MHPCSLVPLPWLKMPKVFFFLFNSERHSVMESSSNESHMEATQAQITCWYSKRHCYNNIWAFLANWQCVFCTWYLIWVEARFGVRLGWSRRVLLVWNRLLLLAFSDILFGFISTITSRSSALRVSGSDFLQVSVSAVSQSLELTILLTPQ